MGMFGQLVEEENTLPFAVCRLPFASSAAVVGWAANTHHNTEE